MSSSYQIVASSEQVSSNLSGEAVILHLKSGTYYGLNPVGASVWSLIQQPKTVAEIRDVLLSEYSVEPEICDRELQDLLNDLESAGLIEIRHEATA
jgi:hypothetical protein